MNVEYRTPIFLASCLILSNADSTHPDIAALVTPLSASRIEGILFSLTLFLYPLSAEGEERVVQRSADRVSRLCALLSFTSSSNIRYSVCDIYIPLLNIY